MQVEMLGTFCKISGSFVSHIGGRLPFLKQVF